MDTVRLRLLLPAIAALAGAAGVMLPGAVWADPDLALLIRFMAVLKAAMAVGAVLLMEWRLLRPVRPGLVAMGTAAVALMACGAGLIWSMAHIAAGAVLFHAGLFGMIAVAWRDGASWPVVSMVRPQPVQGRATGTATSFLRRNGSVQGGS